MSSFKMTAKEAPAARDLPGAGNQAGVLVGIIDLGTQQSEYQGKVRKGPAALLVWELTTCPLPGSKFNHVIGRDYSLTFMPSSGLRVMLEKWRGKKFADGEEFDLEALLGKECLVDVVHQTSKNTGKAYAKLGGVSKPPAGYSVPKPTRPITIWTIADNDTLPEHLDSWLPYVMGTSALELIRHSPEWVAKTGNGSAQQQQPIPDDREEEIPF